MQKDLSALRIDPDKRERGGPNIRLITVVIIAVIAVVLIVWYLAAKRGPVIGIATARAVGGSSTAVLNASGYVTPRRRSTISAKITGKIKEILIEEGMAVEAGQVIATLDDLDARATLRAAEAEMDVAVAMKTELEVELKNARRTLERQRELRERNLNSQEDLDNAETAVSSLEASIARVKQQITAAERNVAIARRGLENCTIRSPFAGIVVSKDAQPGEMVSPISAGGGYTRTGIATVVDMESLEIEVDVNESYIARVKPGQRVEAILDAYPDWRIPASVLTVIPTADRQKATVRVRIKFDELDPRILPDMGVKVTFLEEHEERTDAPKAIIPRRALRTENGDTYVFVVKNGKVERRAITAGRDIGDDIEVIAGLRGNEKVVTESSTKLHDGQRIRIKE